MLGGDAGAGQQAAQGLVGDELRRPTAVGDEELGGPEMPGLGRADEVPEADRGCDGGDRAGQGRPVFADEEQQGECGRGDLCLLYTSPSPRDKRQSRMPSSA